MITDWPHLRDSHSARIRGMTSAVPPAGNGTTIFTTRVGYSCPRTAETFRTTAMHERASAENATNFFAVIFVCPLIQRRPALFARNLDKALRDRQCGGETEPLPCASLSTLIFLAGILGRLLRGENNDARVASSADHGVAIDVTRRPDRLQQGAARRCRPARASGPQGRCGSGW